MFSIEVEKRCLRELKNLDKPIVQRAFEHIEKVIAHDPYSGKELKGKYRGLFSYRFSDYRIVYKIEKSRLVVVVLRVRHRKHVYDGL